MWQVLQQWKQNWGLHPANPRMALLGGLERASHAPLLHLFFPDTFGRCRAGFQLVWGSHGSTLGALQLGHF